MPRRRPRGSAPARPPNSESSAGLDTTEDMNPNGQKTDGFGQPESDDGLYRAVLPGTYHAPVSHSLGSPPNDACGDRYAAGYAALLCLGVGSFVAVVGVMLLGAVSALLGLRVPGLAFAAFVVLEGLAVRFAVRSYAQVRRTHART